ncbi:MAG TPA: hypothetical protein VNN77_18035 [candidate division Zixibacteria bacterium]|nr:hypothetical protein [candidate division Zixibacteria bacterium]
MLVERISRRRSELFQGIEITGDEEFRRRTRAALALLGLRGFLHEIEPYLAAIREGRRSGMRAWMERPTFVVGRPTWSHSLHWYAGAIAHDACHSRLYREGEAWTGAEAERRCLAFQLQVLRALGAEPALIAWVERWECNPSYQGSHRGWRSWLDYLRRRW